MAINFKEQMIIMAEKTLAFHNIDKWNAKGFTGKGIRILEVERWDDDHGIGVVDQMELGLADAEIFQASISSSTENGVLKELRVKLESGTLYDEEAIAFLNSMDIIGASTTGYINSALEEILLNTKAVLGSAAGNDAEEGVEGRFKLIGESIGALKEVNGKIVRENYSARGDDELDFMMFHGAFVGTSFAYPYWVIEVALIMQKYPNKLTQENVHEVFKSISVDLGDLGFDTDYGWGTPILPEDFIIPMLEEEKTMIFKDTKEHWAKDDIDKVSEAGLMMGFEDGSFKPDLAVTRAELATVLARSIIK